MNEKTDVSVEQVALLAQQNTLPEPTLDISMLSYSAAAQPQSLAAVATATYNHTQPTTSATQQASGGSSSPATTTIAAGLRSTAVPPPPADDPWGRAMVGLARSALLAGTASLMEVAPRRRVFRALGCRLGGGRGWRR